MKNVEIRFEPDMPISAAAGKTDVIPMAAFSRRTLLVGGTAVGSNLLLGRMAVAKSVASAAQAGADPGKTQTLTARTCSSSRHKTHYWETGPANAPLIIFLHFVRWNKLSIRIYIKT